MPKHDLCFVGLENLPVLAPEYNRFGSGGEQVQQTLLSRALIRRGYRVSMVVLDHGQPDGAVWDGVTTFRAYRAEDGLYGLRFIYPRWIGMWRALERADAGTYYVSCAGMRVGLTAMFCRRKGRRLVFRAASDSDCRPQELPIRYARDRVLYEFGLKRTDMILTQTLRQQSDLEQFYRLKSTIAGMLVEAPARLLTYSERDIDVLWVNNLAHFKRPDLLVDLARLMPHCRFVMIGGTQAGAESLAQAAHSAAAELDNLEFLGPVPYHDVNAFYSRARLFVNTSDLEGFPNSYLQSWVRATPLVAFFDPDGLIVREKLGVVPKDIAGMAQAIDDLLSNEAQWSEFGRRGVAFMEREFSEGAILRPYLEALGPPGASDMRAHGSV